MPPSYTAAVIVLGVAVAVIISLLAAVTAAFLARAEGASSSSMVSRGGMAFATTLTLLALIVTTISDLLT
ncbi:hypothetical protein [Streptomyces sp. NPDC086766]|uniref:hypothetical protein n=1 Tax=Streptomyces sp. NPDC086766 TaxID=3365754 RepID=UPI0037F3D4B2